MAVKRRGGRAGRGGGGLNLAASAPGWESSITAMHAMPRELKTKVSQKGRKLAEPVAKEVRAAGHSQGGHAARVAGQVVSTVKAGVPTVKATGLPYVAGSEWGGRHRHTTYYSTSPRGRRYLIVARATTMQFRAHKGREGYWFTPTVQEGKGREACLQAWAELVGEVLRDF